MNEPKIEIEFLPCSQLTDEQRLTDIARWLAREYLASSTNHDLTDRKPQPSLLEEVLRDK